MHEGEYWAFLVPMVTEKMNWIAQVFIVVCSGNCKTVRIYSLHMHFFLDLLPFMLYCCIMCVHEGFCVHKIFNTGTESIQLLLKLEISVLKFRRLDMKIICPPQYTLNLNYNVRKKHLPWPKEWKDGK